MRKFLKFNWKKASYRICSENPEIIKQEIIAQRRILENYIESHNVFLTSFVPIDISPPVPDIVMRMHRASLETGLGPMAAVAGAIAQKACETAVHSGVAEAIVENGGDIYLVSGKEIIVGIYTGKNTLENKLAFKVLPDWMPCAICSSSSRMGHSLSLGNCDLACVVARDACLADAAATLACNSVKKADDIDFVMNMIMEIRGILGVLIVEGEKIGLAGKLPEIVKNMDKRANKKITHDSIYSFM